MGFGAMRNRYATIAAQDLSDALLRERQAERNRIARILHDSFLQQCQMILLALDTTPRHLDAIAEEAREAMRLGRDLIVELRQANRPTALGQRLRALGDSLCGRAGMRCEIALSDALYARADAFADELYLCLSEAMRNAVRHARARTVRVRDDWSAARIAIGVDDDGIGIAPHILDGAGSARHFGLTGMRERAAALGATLAITTDPVTGTRVEFRFERSHWPARASPPTD